MYEETRLNQFRVMGKLNVVNSRMIMKNLTPHWDVNKDNLFNQIGGHSRYWWNCGSQQDVNFTTRYVYKFKRDWSIHRRMWAEGFRSGECKVWSKAYLPATRITEKKSNYEGKVKLLTL